MKLEAEGGAGLARFSSACVNKLRLQTDVHVGFCLGEYSAIYKPFSQKTSCCLWVNEKWFRVYQCSQPIRWFRAWPLCSGMAMKMWVNVWECWKSCASTPTKEYRKKLIDNKEGKRDGSSTASWLKNVNQYYIPQKKNKNISSFFPRLLFWHFHHPQELCMCHPVQ